MDIQINARVNDFISAISMRAYGVAFVCVERDAGNGSGSGQPTTGFVLQLLFAGTY
jgi:hypothetical protein